MILPAALAAPASGPARQAPGAATADASGAGERELEERLSEEFGLFYDRTKLALRGYLAATTHDGGLADDLAQEAFLRLYTAKRPFENDEHRRRYLFRIASNLLTDHWRETRHATVPLEDALLERSSHAALRERPPDLDTRRDLARALGRLLPRERQIVWLAHVEHLSHRDIAAVVGVGEASVRVLLFRARKRLAEALRGAAPDSQPQGGAT